jgi:phage FluMu protein gp41
MSKDAAERKRRSRAAARERGRERVETVLTSTELERLQWLCQMRGGVRGPYSVDEYLSLLIHRDYERLQAQLAALGTCAKCGHALPAGCEGVLKGDAGCWHTARYRELEL